MPAAPAMRRRVGAVGGCDGGRKTGSGGSLSRVAWVWGCGLGSSRTTGAGATDGAGEGAPSTAEVRRERRRKKTPTTVSSASAAITIGRAARPLFAASAATRVAATPPPVEGSDSASSTSPDLVTPRTAPEPDTAERPAAEPGESDARRVSSGMGEAMARGSRGGIAPKEPGVLAIPQAPEPETLLSRTRPRDSARATPRTGTSSLCAT